MISSEPTRNPLLSALDTILPVFGALAAILAVRLFLLFAVIGAFVLAYKALSDATGQGIYVLVAYCAFTVLPLVYLDIHGKRKG